MKTLSIALCLLIVPALVSLSSADALTFTEIHYFPDLAPYSYGYQGVGLSDGRLLLWNGDSIYIQSVPRSQTLSLVASGYAGDPGFVALAADGHSVILGAGYSGALYRFDVNAPVNYTPASKICNVSHFSGLFLRDDLLLVDAGNGTRSDLIAVGIGETSCTYAVVVAKPDLSHSCNLCLAPDGHALYAMDGNTGKLQRFDALDIINAYDTKTPFPWASGETIGTSGDFYKLGVCGITPTGNLIIAGSEGWLLPGGIQIVDPQTGNIIDEYDPSGIAAYTSVIYNQYSHDLFAYTNGKVYRALLPDPRLHLGDTVTLSILTAVYLVVGICYLRKRRPVPFI